MRRIYLLRHAETDENRHGILISNADGRLSTTGIQQAHVVAKELANVAFTKIYTSDLGRALKTAKIIATYHQNTPIEQVTLLREKNQGIYDGLTYDQLEETDWPKAYAKDPFHATPPNGESAYDVYMRSKTFISTILSTHTENETLLIVTHEIVCRALFTILNNYEPEFMQTMDRLNNAVYIELEEQTKNQFICLQPNNFE